MSLLLYFTFMRPIHPSQAILGTARVHDFGLSVLATARLPTYESTRSDEGRVKPFLLRVHDVICPAYYTNPCLYFTISPRAPTSADGAEGHRPLNVAVTWCGDLWDNESVGFSFNDIIVSLISSRLLLTHTWAEMMSSIARLIV